MIRVGIVGAAGYTAGELIRLILHHPEAELAVLQSNSQAGRPVHSIHADLMGELELFFSSTIDQPVDVLFLCSGHGRSRAYLDSWPPAPETVIIDLSNEFRLSEDWVYGLPELNRERIRTSKRIANPGCFATAIQLGLLPLAQAAALNADIHINGITGSTGAGQTPVPTTHFSWRQNNVSLYKAFRHQHLAEIERSLRQLQPQLGASLLFLPVRGNFARGIFISQYLKLKGSLEQAQALYAAYYGEHPFVVMSPENPHLKQVVNTNKCLIYLERHDERLLIVSMIDNLLKGASGQAVQNMNLCCGLPETTGLQLKAMAF